MCVSLALALYPCCRQGTPPEGAQLIVQIHLSGGSQPGMAPGCQVLVLSHQLSFTLGQGCLGPDLTTYVCIYIYQRWARCGPLGYSMRPAGPLKSLEN